MGHKSFAVCLILILLLPLSLKAQLTEEQRIDILIKISSEKVTTLIPLPAIQKEKNALVIHAGEEVDFEKEMKERDKQIEKLGISIAAGTLVDITGVHFEKNYILFEINGGVKRTKWYERIQLGGGGSIGGTKRSPTGLDGWQEIPGSWIKLQFKKEVPPLTPDELKKMLSDVFKFGQPSATTNFIDTLPEEFRQPIKEHKAVIGMNRDLVIIAMGRPMKKVRETKDNKQYEDWIYGEKPFKVTFVTFVDNVVVSVKEFD